MKERLLAMLSTNEYVSGEQMAKQLGVSRAAIWKGIRQLREEGFVILAAPKRGYRLERKTIYHPSAIAAQVDAQTVGKHIVYFDALDSTNTYLMNRVQQQDGLCVIAGEQSGGKGRMCGQFYSPKEHGIYLSVLFLPQSLSYEQMYLFTDALCLAVAHAVEALTGAAVQIRWPGDLYLGGRKICGMLNECRMEVNSGKVESLVCGIGIHVSNREFPENIRPLVTSIAQETGVQVNRCQLAAAVLSQLDEMYREEHYRDKAVLDCYKAHLDVLGKKIILRQENGRRVQVKIVDVDNRGGLVVEGKDGEISTAYYGEVEAC